MSKSLFNKLIIITSLGFLATNWLYYQASAKSEVILASKNNFLDTQDYGNPPAKEIEPPKVIFTQPQAAVESTTTQPIVNNYHKLAKLNVEIGYPLTTPINVNSNFGWRINPLSGMSQLHEGVDFPVPIGTPIVAVADGKIETARDLNGYGLIVIIRHQQNTRESRYAHLSQIFVQPGEYVKEGTVIGLSGNTGMSTGPHLHFEWRELEQGIWVATDPSQLLAQAHDKMLKDLAEKAALTKLKPSDYQRAPRQLESLVEIDSFPVNFALQMPNQVNSLLRRRFFGLPEHFFNQG
ncbi:MAG: M23 family metallopeptidase [Gloeocapsa sp. DLM2.Bin57]|nr:MAG: M23 family metallopeptidase [Gloeocapsa sp. DLM2.Bin57]